MIITSARSFTSLAIGVLLAFSHVLDASNLNEELEPRGQLGIRLDFKLATLSSSPVDANHKWMFSSHLTFNEEVKTITDGQLTKIAGDAFREMEVDFNRYGVARGIKLRPGVMTVLAFGKEIILVSSQKGLGPLIDQYLESAVSSALELCKTTFYRSTGLDVEHAHGGKCGEPMALHLYYRTHSDQPLPELTDRARITTVRRAGENDYPGMLPCGTARDDTWGCNILVDKQRVDYLHLPGSTVEGEDYDFETMAGGVAKIDQIPSCT